MSYHVCYPQKHSAVNGNIEYRNTHIQSVFFINKLFHSAEIFCEHFLVFGYEFIRKPEQLYFLYHIFVYENVGIVCHLSAFLGMPTHIHNILSSVFKIDNGGRNCRQCDYKRSYRSYRPEDCYKAYHTDYGAHHGKR